VRSLASPSPRLVFAGLSVAILGSVVATAACLTDPPPDLQLGLQPPTILHASGGLQPPEGLVMTLPTLPSPYFTVPVEIEDPSQGCFYSVFVDGVAVDACQLCPLPVSSGVATIDFDPLQLSPGFDITTDHIIKFTVGSSPSRQGDPHCLAEDDTVIWDYEPNVLYDAGALEDGAFPEAGSSDALLLIPESGTDP
jgi:hypothetical protein